MDAKKHKTKLKPLPSELQSIVRSGITMNSVAQCVEELVYNSIDAGAKNVRIGVNLDQFNVRVEDDGAGLTEADLEVVGVRYNTSKCNSLADLNKLTYYGFRGEALASIVKTSNTLDIITRPKTTPGVELKKKFENGDSKGFVEKYNTSIKTSGTTVIVGKLLSRLPVRQQRIDKSIQLEDVKSSLEKIALINPSLNIELRNEKNGTQLFYFQSASCYADAINQIFLSRIGFEVKFIEEHFLHKKLFFNLSVSNDFVKKKHYQFVFLNNRFIRRCRIHKWVGNFILDRRKDTESPQSDKYPIFILNIACPFGEYDITLEPKKQSVEFKDWDSVYSGIDGLVTKLKHKNSFVYLAGNDDSIDKNTSLISSHDVKGALHSRFVTRNTDVSSNKSSCSDSDRGSIGKIALPKPEVRSTRRNHNLTRTGHSTHVVNVREIRKKRKLENATISKPSTTVSKQVKADKCDVQPKLTLTTFKKFAEWEDEFVQTDAVPPKRIKESHHQEDYKYYVPDVYSNEREIQVQQSNEASHLNWKINRYLDDYQPGVSESVMGVKDASINSKESLSQSSQPLDPSSPPYRGGTTRAPVEFPKTPNSPYGDAESSVFGWAEEVVRTHLNGKVTLKKVKQDIVARLFKYYRTTEKANVRKVTKGVGANTASTKLSNPSKLNNNSRSTNVELPKQLSTKKPSESELHSGKPFSITSAEDCRISHQETRVKAANVFSGQPATSVNRDNELQVDTRRDLNPETHIFGLFTNQQKPNPVAACSAHQELSLSFKPEINIFSEKTVKTEEQAPIFPVLKPAQLDFFQMSKGNSDGDSSCAPPLLNLFPVQKSFSTDWNDQMLSNDYNNSDEDLFPPDWSTEIVTDSQGQEWLQTLDNNQRHVYINLSTGNSAYDIAHRIGPVRKITVGEMKRTNPVRYNWLRKQFPRGFKQFWRGQTREVAKEGDLTKLNNSTIGESLLKCINKKQENDHLSKWTEVELQNVSKYFSSNAEPNIKSVNNIKIAGVQCWKDLGATTSSFRFSREDFEFVRVIGQYDRKFILAGIRKSSVDNETLVIFDQHAVHERIRLEQLIADSYKNPKATLKFLRGLDVIPPYSLPLSETEVRIMQNYAELFRQAALKFETVTSKLIRIKMVPKCIVDKCTNETAANREETFRNLVHSLIQELIHLVMETKASSLSALPKVVHNILCSQACHGAIKFGDTLNVEQCRQLILSIRNCKNLFQCAHGRPTVVPLITGQDMLKVLGAGQNFFQDRAQTLVPSNLPFPLNEECSEYFCDPPTEEKTSAYFSFMDASAPNAIAESNHVAKGRTIINDNRDESSTTSNFFSLLLGESTNTKDDESSPYFFGGQF